MVVARDISAAQPDFDPNAPVATWFYHERVWQQWEVPQWRLFSLVFHTDPRFLGIADITRKRQRVCPLLVTLITAVKSKLLAIQDTVLLHFASRAD
jgi:hypothetical protein